MAARVSKKLSFFAPVNFPSVERFFMTLQSVLSEYLVIYFFDDDVEDTPMNIQAQRDVVRRGNVILKMISEYLIDGNSDAYCSSSIDECKIEKNTIRQILESWNNLVFSDDLNVPSMMDERFDILRHQYALNPCNPHDLFDIYCINTKNYGYDIGYQMIAKKMKKHERSLHHSCDYEEADKMKKKFKRIGKEFGCKHFEDIIIRIITDDDDEDFAIAQMWKSPKHRSCFFAACKAFKERISGCEFCSPQK
jgi:hypothetical protein